MGNSNAKQFKWEDKFEIIDNNQSVGKLTLMSRQTEEQYLGRQLTTNNLKESQDIDNLIDLKMGNQCSYVTSLCRTAFKSVAYCSDLKKYYFLFKKPLLTLKEQSMNRKFKHEGITEEQIELILEGVIKALIYLQQIGHPHQSISSSSIYITEDRNIMVGDPWLFPQNDKLALNLNINGYTYPSPEKILYQNDMIYEYDPFLSDYYSLGVLLMGIKLMEHMDVLYDKGFRRVYEAKIQEKLGAFQNQNLKQRIRILLNHQPNYRKKIHQYYKKKDSPITQFVQKEKEKFKKAYMKSNLETSVVKQWDSNEKETQKHEYPHYQQQNHQQHHQQQQFYSQNIIINKQSIQPPKKVFTSYHHPPSNNQTRNNYTAPYQKQNNFVKPHFDVQTKKDNFFDDKATYSIQPTNKPPAYQIQNNYNFNQPNLSIAHTSRDVLPQGTNQKTKILSFAEFLKQKNVNVEQEKSSTQLTKKVEFKPQNQNSVFNYEVKNSFNDINQQNINESKHQSNFNKGVKQAQSINMSSDGKSQANSEVISKGFKGISRSSQGALPKEQQKDNPRNSLPIEKVSDPNNSFESKQHGSHIQLHQSRGKSDCSEKIILDLIQKHQKNKELTPPKPTSKNRYNSTIRQVSQDSPSMESHDLELKTIEYQSGTRYVGQYKNGKRNGKGKFFYQDGSYYDGFWKDNKMHGEGSLYYYNGKLAYRGQWYLDDFHGKGEFYNADPTVIEQDYNFKDLSQFMSNDVWESYEGSFISDHKNGNGKLKLSNGQIFVGEFEDDLPNGSGRFYCRSGNVIYGRWIRGLLIQQFSGGKQ